MRQRPWTEQELKRLGTKPDDLVDRRCATVEEAACWVRQVYESGRGGPSGGSGQPHRSTYPEIAANAGLILINVAAALLGRQIAAQAAAFEEEGGFTERLYRARPRQSRTP